MFSVKWFCLLLQFLILVPGALSCYLPITKNQLRYSWKKTLVLCCLTAVLFSLTAATAVTVLDIAPNTIGMPILAVSFFLYRRTVKLDLPRSLAVYVGVCAIETFPVQFGTIADMYVISDMDVITLPGCAVLLGSSCLMLVLFVRPAQKWFSHAVEQFDLPRVWYSVTVISSIFLVFNILATPASYHVVLDSRLRYLFPMFEVCALAMLITVYVLFFNIVIGIAERERLEKHSQLLEMQSHQFRELQEYMKQTGRLRHDFRQSVHILSALAEKGDLDSVRAHLSEYEQRLNESAPVCYCANTALNALFGYYHEMAASLQIKTDWKIELPEPLTVSELDMAALFGNLMENAIAACAALPEDGRYFGLFSKIRHGNSLYVVSTNSFDGRVIKDRDDTYRSTKHSGKGTGLASIAAVAEKYGGSSRAYHSGSEFFVDIFLKI